MPVTPNRNCWMHLTQISQTIGQINGTAYQCEKWNMPAIKNLWSQVNNLRNKDLQRQIDGCPVEALDMQIGADEGPLAAIENILANMMNFDEPNSLERERLMENLAAEEVNRRYANEVVGEIQTYWMQVTDRLADWFATTTEISVNRWAERGS